MAGKKKNVKKRLGGELEVRKFEGRRLIDKKLERGGTNWKEGREAKEKE